MALATESAGKVRQKTYEINRGPGVFYALKALFLHLATNKGNPDLQLVNIDSAVVDDAGGQDHGIDAACKVYAIYLKKKATATAVAYVLLDDATNDAGGETDARVQLWLSAASQEVLAIYPDGLDFTTGLVSKAYSNGYGGAADSAAADTPNGFIVLGA